MKTATKKPAKKTTPRPEAANEPSADASPRFKALVAAATAPPAEDASTEDTPPEPPPAAPAAATEPTEYLPPADAPFAAGHPPFRTLRDLAASYCDSLAAQGASLSTRASYAHDLETALRHLGAETDPATLTVEAITAFETSPAVLTTKTGRVKSPLSIAKTRRVLRLALAQAHAAGRLDALPYQPKAKPLAPANDALAVA